ncbi:MAG: lysylphosphatidylglycerol synthase transmembrane domain-containing protein [Bacteroidota bacterium]
MNKRLISILKYLFFLGLGIFLVWWSLHQIPDDEWDKFKEALAKAHYWLVIPVFLILSTSHLLRALRWKTLMEPMGYHPSLRNTFFAVMIGYLANLAVPRLGEVLKCTILAKYEKVPAEKIIGTIVAERVFDVLCLGLIFLLALILQFDVVTGSYQHVKSLRAPHPEAPMSTTKLVIILVIALAIAIYVIRLIVTKKWRILITNIKKIIAGIWEGLITARKLKHKWAFILYSISIWALYIAGTWIGFHATDGTADLGFKEAVSCLAFASIGMIITPGGIGAYAFLLAKVLEQNDVTYAIGIANGTLQWFAQCIIVLVVGGFCLVLLPFYNKQKKDESS